MWPMDRLDIAKGRGLTLGVLLERLGELHGSRLLVEEADGGLKVSFADAAAVVDRWAAGVAERTEAGDRVVIATPNGYEQLLLILAVSRAGRLPVPVNPQMSAVEVDHVEQDSAATLVIRAGSDIDQDGRFGRAVPADPGDVGALFYTSGTTGKPKGAQLTHRSLLGGMSIAALVPGQLRHQELVLGLPVAHIFGFAIAVGAACAGLRVHFFPRFNPVMVLDAIEARRSSVFAGVPAMYRMLEEAGAPTRDLRCVRLWISGADAMPSELSARFKGYGATLELPLVHKPIGEAIFAEGYGMVETGGGVAIRISPPLLPTRFGGSVGVPLPGNKFKVVSEDGSEVATGGVGELHLSGPGILKGYYGAPEATAGALTDDGWLRTGDVVRKGLFGMFSFEGRMKDVIKRGGYSVYAVEVEQTLEEHADVLEAAVVPLPDPRDGEVPVAVVRLTAGTDLESLGLGEWARARLSRYKVPVRFMAVDEFPRTGTDKVQRGEVLAMVLASPVAQAATEPKKKAVAKKKTATKTADHKPAVKKPASKKA